MKKLVLFICCTCIVSTLIVAQCPTQNLIFNTQTQLNTFADSFPNCTDFQHSIRIQSFSAGGVNNLTPLQNIEKVRGGFAIINSDALMSLTGLENLDTIQGFLEISSNDNIGNFAPLSGLQFIGQGLSVSYNSGLTHISNFSPAIQSGSISISDNLQLLQISGFDSTMGTPLDVYIAYNEDLTDVSGFGGLQECNLITITQNEKLQNIDAFKNLETLNTLDISFNAVSSAGNFNFSAASFGQLQQVATISIGYNDKLASLPPFNNLQELSAHFLLMDNALLSSLSGFDNLNNAANAGIQILQNDVLSTISGFGSLSKADFIDIEANPQLQSISAFSALDTVKTAIEIKHNALLTDIAGFAAARYGEVLEIENNDQLPIINAFDNWNSAWLFIKGNNSLQQIQGFPLFVGLGVEISDNDLLDTLGGFAALTNTGMLSIDNNDNLKTINGFAQLLSVSNFTLMNNAQITNLSGLSGLQTAGAFIVTDNDALTSLADIMALQNITNKIIIEDNALLADMACLTALDTFAGLNLAIRYNPSLTDLSDIDNIWLSPYSLYINGNANLTVCNVSSICALLGSSRFDWTKHYIYDNSSPCNSIAEVAENCGITTEIAQMPMDAEFASIFPNPASHFVDFMLAQPTQGVLRLYNAQGIEVLQFPINFQQTTYHIDISHLAAGLYFGKIETPQAMAWQHVLPLVIR